jgi:hypothetical protein
VGVTKQKSAPESSLVDPLLSRHIQQVQDCKFVNSLYLNTFNMTYRVKGVFS